MVFCDTILTPNVTAFNKGPLLIYAGQESESIKVPSLFDKDTIERGNNLQNYITRLTSLKKQLSGKFTIIAGNFPLKLKS